VEPTTGGSGYESAVSLLDLLGAVRSTIPGWNRLNEPHDANEVTSGDASITATCSFDTCYGQISVVGRELDS
jgi:hypothetical protein